MKKIIVLIIVSILCLFSCTDEPVPHAKQTNNKVPTGRTRRENKKAETVVVHDNNEKMTGPQIFETYNSAVFMVFVHGEESNHQGSGFFVSSSGLALSNYHVFHQSLMGDETIKVGNRQYNVERVVSESKDEDWVLFKVDGNRFSFIPLAKHNPKVGDKVFALGSPRGLENTLSSGEISQIRSEGKLLQTSAPIDHGSSGGALINEYGKVVGITTAGYDDSGANLNFAVSIQLIRYHLNQ